MIRLLLILAMAGAALGIAAGFLGPVHPAFDLVSNFRLHLSVGLLAGAIILFVAFARLPALVFALVAAAGIAGSAAGLPLPASPASAGPDERVYRLFSMNLLWNNATPDEVVGLIERHDPDLVFLVEYTDEFAEAAGSLGEDYPYLFHCPEWRDFGGSAIFSRLPLDSEGDFCGEYASLGLTHAEISGKRVALGIVHLRWPWPASGPRQITALTPVLEKIGPDALVAGDYNSTSWSHSTHRFHRAGGLTGVAGIGPTWAPQFEVSGSRLQFPQRLGLPIDNAAVKGAVRTVSARTLPHAGSDHLPVLLEFVVR